LATAATYGALAVRGIINTGSTIVNGNIGTTGQTISGFPPGVFTGTSGAGTAAVTQARADALSAYSTAIGLTSTTTLAAELSGNTLEAGVYKITRAGTLSGPLTLDGNGTFVFQIASTFVTSPGAEIILTNGAESSDIFWAVGSTVTLGANNTFAGNIIAQSAITLGAETTIDGGIFAGSSITLNDNTIAV